MNNNSLQEFAHRIRQTKRIGKQDVQHLQRHILPDGVMSREEAELLIALDTEAGTVHASWPIYLVGAITDFAVWGSRPTGYIDRDTALWLKMSLTGKGIPSPRAARVLAEIIAEAQEVDASLLTEMAAPTDWARRNHRPVEMAPAS